jgi:Bacterial protein of unknown function (DUF839)
MDTTTDRRTFVRRGAMGAGALWMVSLQELMGRRAYGATLVPSPYGPIQPTPDGTTGLELLRLPEGFRYWSYSWTGDLMTDGVACPSLHDGMAVVDELNGRHDDDPDDGTSCGPEDDEAERQPRDGEDEAENGDDGHRRSGRLVLVRNHEPATGKPYIGDPTITYAMMARVARRT